MDVGTIDPSWYASIVEAEHILSFALFPFCGIFFLNLPPFEMVFGGREELSHVFQ